MFNFLHDLNSIYSNIYIMKKGTIFVRVVVKNKKQQSDNDVKTSIKQKWVKQFLKIFNHIYR